MAGLVAVAAALEGALEVPARARVLVDLVEQAPDREREVEAPVEREVGLPAITAGEMPRLFAGVYGLGSRDFRPEHTIGAYEYATGTRARKDGKRASDGASFMVLGVDGWKQNWSKEAFILRESRLPSKTTPETDLFAGLT